MTLDSAGDERGCSGQRIGRDGLPGRETAQNLHAIPVAMAQAHLAQAQALRIDHT